MRVLGVRRPEVALLVQEREAGLPDLKNVETRREERSVVHCIFPISSMSTHQFSHNVVAGLDAELFGHLGEVVEEGPEVDPVPARLQHLADHLDEVHDVVGAVDEEARDYAVLETDRQSCTYLVEKKKTIRV